MFDKYHDVGKWEICGKSGSDHPYAEIGRMKIFHAIIILRRRVTAQSPVTGFCGCVGIN